MDGEQVQRSLRALLWDVDGTLAETELDGHRVAFNEAFAAEGLPWRWDVDTYRSLLAVSGGRERLRSFLIDQHQAEPEARLLDALVRHKQLHYDRLLAAGDFRLRPGVRRLIEAAAAAGLTQAVVTTSARAAATALIGRLFPDPPMNFAFLVCGEDVSAKKPAPEAYQLALIRLGLPAAAVVAIEDSGNGVRAAVAAGLRCLVTVSAASREEPPAHFQAAGAVVNHLGGAAATTQVLQGPPCRQGWITLSYIEQLAAPP